MMRFRDFSIKTKLSILTVTSSAIALVLSCLAFVSNDMQMLKAAKVGECQTLANILGAQSLAALSHRDTNADNDVLRMLESQTTIDHALLLDANAQVVARYDKDPERPLSPSLSVTEGYSFTETGALELRHPIRDGSKDLGTLLLYANITALRSQLFDCGKISLVVMVVALNVVVFFTSCAQGFIARPILDLADVARRVWEEGDYSVRSSWDSDDEVGVLHTAFNDMLDRIQASDLELEKIHGRSEELARTCETQSRLEIAEHENGQSLPEHACTEPL